MQRNMSRQWTCSVESYMVMMHQDSHLQQLHTQSSPLQKEYKVALLKRSNPSTPCQAHQSCLLLLSDSCMVILMEVQWALRHNKSKIHRDRFLHSYRVPKIISLPHSQGPLQQLVRPTAHFNLPRFMGIHSHPLSSRSLKVSYEKATGLYLQVVVSMVCMPKVHNSMPWWVVLGHQATQLQYCLHPQVNTPKDNSFSSSSSSRVVKACRGQVQGDPLSLVILGWWEVCHRLHLQPKKATNLTGCLKIW